MSSFERESSRERDLVVRHQHSFSDSGRGPVPMWDSSDPERAPPPLPLNPGSSPVANKNASKNVTAAAEAIAARARENMFIAQSIKARSNEKSLMKDQFQKRLTTIQPGAVKDLSAYLESNRSPEKSKALDVAKSPEKSLERSPSKGSLRSLASEKSPEKRPESALERFKRTSIDLGRRSPERSTPLPSSPTPTPKSPLELSRPSSRREFKPILGETPPQSATMKALQATPSSEPDRTTRPGPDSSALIRAPQNLEAISNQIMGLTSIATRLQQEMAALSRRSKDNATDLISLKEATNARDEDVRKSLRDLISRISHNVAQQGLKDTFGKETDASSKSLSFPGLHTSGKLSSEDRSSPSAQGSSTGIEAVGLLEKVLKEMATKEGQDELMASITSQGNKAGNVPAESRLTKQLEEVIGLLKDHALSSQHNSRALVRTSLPPPPPMENRAPHFGSAPNSPHGGPMARTARNITPRGPPPAMNGSADTSRSFQGPPRPGDFVNDEIFKLLKRMKDSIAEGGGMSAEIKALVRELRGEVLGMGREIGRKLDQNDGQTRSRDLTNDHSRPDQEAIHEIVRGGLEDLKIHFEHASREIRRQSSSSVLSKATVDNREIYAAVKSALRDLPPNNSGHAPGIQREEILEAVREAWETYKPEIEMQNFGLERDEILQCLREGLEEHRAQNPRAGSTAYEEVLDAVRDGLKDFNPPTIHSESAMTREEIVMTMRECIEEFGLGASGPDQRQQFESLREDVLDAVRDGMAHASPISKEISFDRQDLFEAVQTSLQNNPITAELFDTIKERMEGLRASIETYVDRAADVTGKDEIIETVRGGLSNLRADLEASIANAPRGGSQTNNNDLLDAMEKEFEHLRSTISISVTRGNESSLGGREELLDAIRDGFDELKGAARARGESSVVGDSGTVMEELKHLRTTLAANLTRGAGAIDREEILDTVREGIDKAQIGLSKNNNRPESILSASSELMEVFNESLETLKSDIERIVNKPIDMTVNYEILDTLKEGLRNLRADLDGVRTQRPRADTASTKRGGEVVIADEEIAKAHSSNLGKLEVMMTQLQMKVESLDTSPSQPPDASSRPDIERLETSLKETQKTLSEVMAQGKAQQDIQVSKEDTDAIETLLRNTKASIEENNPIEQIESLEALMREAKDAIDEVTSKQESETATKTDLAHLEVIIKDLQSNLHEIRDQGSEAAIGREEHEALAETCTEMYNTLKAIAPANDGLASKTDFNNLQDLLEEFQETHNANARLQAQAFDARKIEHGGLADKMEETRTYVESIREDLKTALNSQHDGIESINVALGAIEEAVTGGAVVSTLKVLRDNIEAEFTKSQANLDASRSDMEIAHKALFEKHDEHKSSVVTELTSKLEERFDELMTKYDDAERSALRKEEALDSKASEQAEAMESTRAAAEDLKILIDTLGSTVTETCERMTEDSKTVYNRVDEIGSKVEETYKTLGPESKTDHQLTRIEVAKSLVAVESLKSDYSDWSPKIMSAVSDILRMMGEHYDEARKFSEEIKVSVEAIPGSINIPALPAPQDTFYTERSMQSTDAFDDSAIHSKLDQLFDSVNAAADNSAQLGTMQDIQEQLSSVAKQLRSFTDSNSFGIAAPKSEQSRESEEVAIAIEKRYAQKDAVEAEIVRLSDERVALEAAVETLREEQKELFNQKAKMQADVQSLETALRLRREEMDLMESRAENLERRVLEGVLDHSRSLLLSSRPSSLKSMDLKRVASNASSTATLTTTGKGSHVGKSTAPAQNNALSSAVGMALKKRQPGKPNGSSVSSVKGSRRILSLSAAGGNRASPIDRSLTLASPSAAGKAAAPLSGGMKRSHSVKSDLPSRKSSWNGPKRITLHGDDLDKENSLLEEDEDEGSEIATDRRTSYTGTFTGTEDSYETESMDGGRSRSYAASNVGSLLFDENDQTAAIQKNSSTEAVINGPGAGTEERALTEQNSAENIKEIVLYGNPTDSGLGTDPPTAGLEQRSLLFAEE